MTRRAAEASQKLDAKGLIIPIFLSTNAGKPDATLRVDRLYTDCLRKGFFRIGVLPIIVGEGVSLEVDRPAQLQAALAKVPTVLNNRRVAGIIELRRIRIVIRGSAAGTLQVDRMRPKHDAKSWQLFDPIWQVGTNSIRAADGELRLGAQPTELLLNCLSGLLVIPLFPSIEFNSATPAFQ